MTTWKQAYIRGRGILEKAEIPDSALDAKYLLEYVTGKDSIIWILDGEKELNDQQEQFYHEVIQKRAGRYPLQYITEKQEFMGYSFYVNENVLIPRQDTECLVEEVLKYKDKISSLLDLCTGSGCIGISIEKMSEAKVTLADISKNALEVAKKNGQKLNSNVTLVESDLFENISGKFDAIVSNPPYIRSSVIPGLMDEVKKYEPMLALDGKEDGLYFYRRIIQEGKEHLNPGGMLFFEIGHDQKMEVMECMEKEGFTGVYSVQDLAGLDRVVVGKV
ncbi:MAG: peptide chain release factor N(5)-glutamine methyltransferase [Lachnospiraceae bacterium]|nr:peptide chain release factor N(5)-glutamine methyltransferase [Lachnospiraceae bacterium]